MSSAHETEIFQHYQVLKRPDGALWELGRGAMGITYKAFDTNLRCDVALKVINALHLNSETARARFLREARAAAGLRHRNVASVYHLGNDDQSFFYAMEFVDGETVECLVKEAGPMPPADALQIVVQIARALGAAARQNLVHRDIKPANIMVTREDDEEEQFVVKVIDFGLARPALGGEGSAHITMGGFVGTPQFASPEQLEEKDLDARSDIYSLGVTLWFMIAGRPPFTGPLGSVFIQQLTKEPPWAQLEGTPEPVKALLAGMLQKEPDKRPQTPVELRRQVEACLRQLPASDREIKPTVFSGSATVTESVANTESPLTRTVVWAAGSLLADRYELMELAGEGTNGRVFRAADRQANGAPLAVKILHGDVLASSAERRRLEGELDKLRGAAHPNLLEFQGLQESADTSFLVGEWVNGFTLVDLLRSRGQLPLSETLRLLAQAATVADHAREHDLRRLELSLHQMMTAFEAPASGGLDARMALTTSLDQWPPFLLKLDALGITREAGDSVTWGGDRTLMPAAPSLGRDTQTSIRGLVEGSDLFALGLMAYELLNGAPPAHSQRGGGREARYVALPALNEAANLVLRRALSPNPGFASNVDFFQALVDASGLPDVYLGARVAENERETFAIERLPVSGRGAEEAGATLILEEGESLPLDEPVTMRGPSAEERAQADAECLAVERAEAEQAEARRVADEQARAEREEAERAAAKQAEAERREEERLQAERAEAQRIEAERIAAERVEAERVAAEKAAAERAEAERLAAERVEVERLKAERLAAERAEAKRLEAERREAERIEAERLAAERAEAKRLEAERLQAEKAAADRLKAERAEARRIEAEAKKAEAERIKAEKAEAARREAIRVKTERAEAKLEQQRAATQLRDIASAAGVGAGGQEQGASVATRKNTKVLAGAAAGALALAVLAIVAFSHGRRTPPAPEVAVRAQPIVKAEELAPEAAVSLPTPPAEVTPDASTPAPAVAAAVEPSPTPESMPEPSAIPAVAAADPDTPPASTPAPVSKQDQSDERRGARNDRAARVAEASRAASRAKEESAPPREREKRPAASEPKKKPAVTAAASKPVENPKPAPAPTPANRPAVPFILR